MENQIMAWLAAGIFVAAVAASFVRTKFFGSAEGQGKTNTVRSQRNEVFEYFGIERRGDSRLMDCLDLSPLEMLSGGSPDARSKKRRGE